LNTDIPPGLQLFAAHAAEEIGSFSALQMGQILEVDGPSMGICPGKMVD
jgi:hypothetical protein